MDHHSQVDPSGPSTVMSQVRNPTVHIIQCSACLGFELSFLQLSIIIVKCKTCCWNNKNKQKEAGVGPNFNYFLFNAKATG